MYLSISSFKIGGFLVSVINMVGKKYGHLTVVEMLPQYKNKKTFCRCICDCGNETIREAYPLRNNYSEFTSCGCKRKDAVIKHFGRDINGQKFGRLTVLETYWYEKKPKVKCRCDCGNIGIYTKNDVQTLHTQSCGCLNKEITSAHTVKDWTGYVSDYGVKAIEPYKQNNKKQWLWKFECPICHKTFVTLPIRVATNSTTSCGCQSGSSGENLIKELLKERNIDFETQYSFDDCKDKHKLLFDFAIMKDDKLLGLIEYDGKQHFCPIDYFGGQKAFEGLVRRDNIKNEYCKTKQIPLLRINYEQSVEEIEEILDKYILSVTTTGDAWQQVS